MSTINVYRVDIPVIHARSSKKAIMAKDMGLLLLALNRGFSDTATFALF